MGMVIMDELNAQEQAAMSKLSKYQREIMKEADKAGGVIYRYKLRKEPHPHIRLGQGKISFPPAGKAGSRVYEAYNKALEKLVEQRLLMNFKRNIYLFSWSGWRIAKVLNRREDEEN